MSDSLRYEVFMAVNTEVEFFWVVITCSVGYQHFGGLCCLRVQGEVTGD
jgi:hypothetical protein